MVKGKVGVEEEREMDRENQCGRGSEVKGNADMNLNLQISESPCVECLLHTVLIERGLVVCEDAGGNRYRGPV